MAGQGQTQQPADMPGTSKRKEQETPAGCGRERLKRHRGEMAGGICVPDAWGMEGLLNDWASFPSELESSLSPAGVSLARQALVAECRRMPPSC